MQLKTLGDFMERRMPCWADARLSGEQAAPLSGTGRLGLPWMVILAFLRITTNFRVFDKPLSIESAISYLDEWLNQPMVTAVII